MCLFFTCVTRCLATQEITLFQHYDVAPLLVKYGKKVTLGREPNYTHTCPSACEITQVKKTHKKVSQVTKVQKKATKDTHKDTQEPHNIHTSNVVQNRVILKQKVTQVHLCW